MKAKTTNAASALLNNLMGGQTITRENFAQLVIAKFKTYPQITSVTYNPDRFSLLLGIAGEDNSSTSFLENAYRTYCNAPCAMRNSVIEQWVNGLITSFDFDPVDFEAALPHLMPVIRGSAYTAMVEAEVYFAKADSKDALAEHRACGNIAYSDAQVFLCLDMPNSILNVSEKLIQKWGVERQDLLTVALANLKKKSTDHRFVKVAPGVFKASFDDGYDSSRVLLPELFNDLPINGDPVVMIPCRDTLLVAGTNDQRGLTTMMKIAAKQINQGNYTITAYAYRYRNGQPEVYFGQTLPQPLRRPMFDLLQQTYQSQGEVMRKHMPDVFIGSLLVKHQSDESTLTIASWAPNDDTALCRAHFINLMNVVDKKIMLVPWEVAEKHFGELLTPMKLITPRYLTKGYPSTELLKSLEKIPGVQTFKVSA